MCGIAGILDTSGKSQNSASILRSMCDQLRHRGPDDLNTTLVDNVGLGFSRLSIIDLESGMQPMHNEDRSIVSICNGEIYNYNEIKAWLESRGHTFRTKSDCEVLPHLYEEVGSELPKHLNGQFAFAVFDRKRRSLFCARDHFGIAPFFYTYVDEQFIFASEIKAILCHDKVSREVDLVGLDQVFTFPGLISPRTMFKNISSLPPGTALKIGVGEPLQISPYWDMLYPENQDGNVSVLSGPYEEELLELLTRAVKRRLIADVPVGLYLSGGLDSTLIGILAQRVSANAINDAFSVDFPEKELSEGRYQRMAAKELGCRHHQSIMHGSQIASLLQQVIFHCECPLKETFNASAFTLSKRVKDVGLKVVLAGQGADELFGGYIGYRFDNFKRSAGNNVQNSTAEERLVNLQLWGDADFVYEKQHHQLRRQLQTLYSHEVAKCLRPDSLGCLQLPARALQQSNFFNKRSYVDFKLRLADHLLGDHGDRMTFANGVEARYPFLDQELVDFIRQMPTTLKIRGFDEKFILKKTATGLVPEAIRQREKFGFTSPGSPFLLKQNVEYINDVLSFSQIKKDGYFDPKSVEQLKIAYAAPGFRVNVPFETDLLAVVLTFGIFRELFDLPQLN